MLTNQLTRQVADHVTLQHGPKYVFAFHAYCSGIQRITFVQITTEYYRNCMQATLMEDYGNF